MIAELKREGRLIAAAVVSKTITTPWQTVITEILYTGLAKGETIRATSRLSGVFTKEDLRRELWRFHRDNCD